jgi:glycosyltransferase involved in cell wall biosynthesis
MNKNCYPCFSVLIATHLRHNQLERAIGSVLSQGYPNCQIVVVSDAYDPNAYQTVSSMLRRDDCFVQRLGDPGPSRSRNIAMKMATGTHIIFLDDDDAFQPFFFENILKFSDVLRGNSIAYVNCDVIDSEQGTSVSINFSNVDPLNLWIKNFIPNNCVIYPAEIAKQCQFDEDLAYEDWDFLLSACRLTKLIHLDVNGPLIYKNSINASGEQSRGLTNASHLIDCYREIYNRYPPTESRVAEERARLFQAAGIEYRW